MKVNLEINNQGRNAVSKKFFETVLKMALKEAASDFLQRKNVSLSLALVSEKEIKDLNRQYRGINLSTDILSFAEYRSRKALEKDKEKKIFLGELILCYDDIKKYVKTESLDLQTDLAKVFSHGILHLIGFRHGQRMFEIQDRVSQIYLNKKWKD
jgi:probable rRNA maturation factor